MNEISDEYVEEVTAGFPKQKAAKRWWTTIGSFLGISRGIRIFTA